MVFWVVARVFWMVTGGKTDICVVLVHCIYLPAPAAARPDSAGTDRVYRNPRRRSPPAHITTPLPIMQHSNSHANEPSQQLPGQQQWTPLPAPSANAADLETFL